MMKVEWLTDDECRTASSMKWLAFDDDIIPAWVAEMDVALPKGVKDALHAAIDLNIAGYNQLGTPKKMGFNDSVASWHRRFFGTNVDPDSVILLPTVIATIRMVLEALLEPGDGVIVNSPVYHPFFEVIGGNGYTIFDVPLEQLQLRTRLDLLAIDQAFRDGAKAILLCNPQNPTGSIATREELEGLAEIVSKHDRLVIADEVHAPLLGAGVDFVSYSDISEAAAQHSVTTSSTSKTYNTPGLRNAWVFTHNSSLHDAMMATPYESRNGASSLGIIAAMGAMNNCDNWVKDLTVEVEARHVLLGELLAEHLPKAKVIKAQAGFLAWVDFSGYEFMGDNPSKWITRNARVALTSGLSFRGGSKGFARINVGTSAERLTRIILRIENALE